MDDEFIHSLVPAVREQAQSADTPFVAQTISRLKETTDIGDDEILYMIAFCLADELERMGEAGGEFDTDRYRMLLEMLPNLPER
jgi:hypothetical protein